MAKTSIETCKKEIESINNCQFEFLKRWRVKTHTFIKVHCTHCNNDIEVERSSFIKNCNKGNGCKYCSGRAYNPHVKRYEIESLSEEYEFLTNIDEITKRRETNVWVKHKCCGYEFKTNMNSLVKYHPCKRCSKIERLTEDNLNKYIDENCNGEYCLVDFNNAKNVHNNAIFSHTSETCMAKGKPFSMTINNFKKGQRCPYCKSSKGEERITNWLNSRNISYEYNKPISEECKKKRALPFDFILSDNVIIEYDGFQHYENGLFNSFDVNERISTDIIKDEYCRNNGITLYRIPYTKLDEIDDIMERILNDDQQLYQELMDEVQRLRRFK